jgi:hypothetical protein
MVVWRYRTDEGTMTDDAPADPRLESAYLTTLDGGAVTLVGVVHDHPASVARVRAVVARRRPDVVALELPPLAVGLYEAHAGAVARSLRGVASVTRTAVACRLAAAVARRPPLSPTVGSRTEYDITAADPPERQSSSADG